MRALLLSFYELGRSPTSVALAAAALHQAGAQVRALDLSRCKLDLEAVRHAELIALSLPMHTATRMALNVIARVRQENATAKLCAFGLYAPLNAALLRERGVDEVLGAEPESDLAALVQGRPRCGGLPKQHFAVPKRHLLPALNGYAQLVTPAGKLHIVGTTDTTRGCKHHCRHCPIPVVYSGALRVIPRDVVLADVAQQVAAGAQHITFGDPDFFNGPAHGIRIVHELHARYPSLTYDVTIKVEHLLRHRHLLSSLKETGCLFITSAVESFDDHALAILDKGHCHADFLQALRLIRENALWLAPTFLPFAPWTTLEQYRSFLATLDALDLVEETAPVQLSIRLLVMAQSPLREHDAVRPHLHGYDAERLSWTWTHPDPRMDALQKEVTALVSQDADRRTIFQHVVKAAAAQANQRAPVPKASAAQPRATVPYLNEPWFC